MMTVDLDPLTGLDRDATRRDGARWEALLAAVAAAGGRWEPAGLFGLLRGLRACGAALEDSRQGWRLDPPPDMTRTAMRDAIGDHAPRLAALLRHAPALRLPSAAAPVTVEGVAAQRLEVQHAFEPA